MQRYKQAVNKLEPYCRIVIFFYGNNCLKTNQLCGESNCGKDVCGIEAQGENTEHAPLIPQTFILKVYIEGGTPR